MISGDLALFVLLGGTMGGAMRYLVSDIIGRLAGEIFPLGTLVVNFTGAVLIGAVADTTTSMPHGLFATPAMHGFVVTGVLGGYTTVSSFCLQTWNLVFKGRNFLACLNVLGSSVFCILGVGGGYVAAIAWLA